MARRTLRGYRANGLILPLLLLTRWMPEGRTPSILFREGNAVTE